MAMTLHQNAADHMAGRLGSGNMEQYMAINAGCSALIAAIAKTVTAIHGLMREVRESRADLDPISSELHSLDGILDILKDDVPHLPEQLAQRTPEVLSYCLTIINELQGCISILDRVGLSRQDKRSRWMASRGHIAKLRWTLEVYKASLGLAVDLVALTSNKQQNEESPVRETFMEDASVVSDGKDELAGVLAQISRVAARLEDESRHNGAVAKLQHYLDALYGNALAAVDREMDHFEGQRNSAHSSTDHAPDSAIDMGDDDHTFVHAKTANIPIPQTQVDMTQDEFDEMLDELREMPVRPPTPPQRSARRSSSAASATRSEYRPSTADSYTSTPYGAGTSFLDLEARSQSPHLRSQSDSAAISPRPAPINHLSHMSGGLMPVRTYGQNSDSLWENPRPAVPVPRPTTSSSNITNSPKPNVLRRSSSRLSSALKGLSFGRQRSHSTTSTGSSAKSSTFSMAMPPTPPTPAPIAHEASTFQPVSTIPPPVPSSGGAIFGVSLANSMSVAKGLAAARHDSGGSSTRDYPLCILRCVYFIQDYGLRAPHIFAQEGDPYRLQRLKAIFSSPETGYGKFLDWNQFTVYEAADMILLYLSSLPQPLIPESVAKRWIAMSRQATMSGSSAIRLDKGIDFWEEALQGIKGPNRSLFKLLLNLWGDVADSVEWNEMTAERLAEKMMRPLMHLPQTRYGTDYMLGLAFVVRKRSEYNAGLKGERSRAAF
ncbi:putative RhoGAP group protein [Sordaria sp. MPI-SDFR-AT-0083]|nr:putative RhoGAP group protein [Sordaria sp. MPI-SDFR-AT-0083]